MTLKVMTWNFENLFRNGTTFGPKTKAVYDAKLDGLARVISEQTPDALAVQEVGEPEALDDLEDRLPGTWHRHVSTHPDKRGIRVAWLSPLTITQPQDLVLFPKPLTPVQSNDKGGTDPAMVGGRWRSRSHPTQVSRFA